jgi:AmiR/NasT family two-component response regulator
VKGPGIVRRFLDQTDLERLFLVDCDIVISASDSPSNIDRAQQLGVTAYVTKPFNLVGLVELVQR